MIIHRDTLLSEDILEQNFICNLDKCKGACCIEGSSGAPFGSGEVELLSSIITHIKPYMSEKGLELLNEKGYFEIDADGDEVTTCLPTGECVFVTYNAIGQLQCAIQNAYQDGIVKFEKPISCHLYPIRTRKVGDYIALNYHQWDICSSACRLGDEMKLPVYKFLKTPLVRNFGAEWYEELEEIASQYLSAK